MSQPDPLDILRRAPDFSDPSREFGIDANETRMCDFRPPGNERLKHRREFVKEIVSKRCRLLLIYGGILLGKAHFAQKIIKDLLNHGFYSGRPVRCLGVTSFESLMTSIVSSLGFPPHCTECNVMTRLTNSNFVSVLLFTNFEDIRSQDEIFRRFSKFLNDMLTSCPNIAVIVTSRAKVNLTHEDYSEIYKLDPPSEAECCQLLQPILQYCKTYAPIFLIVRRCFYRPALVLRVCQIILSNNKILSPEEVAEILEQPTGTQDFFSRFPSPEGSISEAIKRHLSQLPAELKSDIPKLCFLDGSFGMAEATRTLHSKTVAECKVLTLLPLKDHAVLDIDSRTGQMRIEPLIKQFFIGHVRDNDPYKLGMVDYLGHILEKVKLDISVRTKGRALGFWQDYQCLERTITKALHTSGEESYGDYMKFVEIEEGSLSAVCPEKGVQFYKVMVEAAGKFGTIRERAILQGLFAVMLIEKRGDELNPAIEMVASSLSELPDDDYYWRATLLRRLGWINIRLGNNKEAKRLLTSAKKLSFRVSPLLEARIEPHRIHINSHLAIANVFLGKFTDAHRLLASTIPHASQIMPEHPVIAVMLQTMGLKFEREGLIDKAITAYQVSGNARRKFVETLPSYLVTNHSNLASMYLWRGKTEKALPLLEVALNIRRKLGWNDYNTALVLWHRGNAYLFSCRPDEAKRSLNQAIEVLIRCTPSHTTFVNIRVALAHAHMVQGRRLEAVNQLQQALSHSSVFQLNINDNSLLTTLEHLVLMKRGTDEFEDIHKRLIQEAQRLSDVSKDGDYTKHVLMQRKLTEWRVYLVIVLEGNATIGQRDDVVYARQSTGSNLTLDWNVMFTCEHCKRLNINHDDW